LEITSLSILSPSKLKTFLTCPRKYYYDYIERRPSEKHPAAALGTAVHKTIETVYKERIDPVLFFLNEFDAELARHGIELDAYSKYKMDGVKMVGDYDYAKRIPIEMEYSFRALPFPNQADAICAFNGIIDQTYEWGFVDLKTNARKPSQTTLDNDPQFIIYNWAFEEIFNYKPERNVWHHLRTHEDIDADVDGKLDQIIRDVTTLLATDFTAVRDTPVQKTCFFCPHKNECLGVREEVELSPR